MIGQTCRGMDLADINRDGWAGYIADEVLAGREVSTYAVERYRDALTDVRDMRAMNAERVAMRQAEAS